MLKMPCTAQTKKCIKYIRYADDFILGVKDVYKRQVYRLIVHSKLPSAERFERWVFDEVLPSIRQHGAYPVSYTHLDVYKRQAQRFPQNGWKPFGECKGRREPDCDTDGGSRYESRT